MLIFAVMARRNKRVVLENLEVIDAGAKGKAVARAEDGRVVFINNAIPGDVVDVQTFKKRKSYYEGTAISFSKYSDKRVDPVCEHFGTCGGCKWQSMGYEHQLFFKQKEVENNLRRLGGLDLPTLTTILGSKEQYFYRNKMEFSFSFVVVGFAFANQDLVDVLNKVKAPYNLSSLNQAAAIQQLQNQSSFEAHKQMILKEKLLLERELQKMSFIKKVSSVNWRKI